VELAYASLAAAGGDGAFYAVFGVFVAAFVVLAVVTLRWAVRRDKAGRAEWAGRRSAAQDGADGRAQSDGAAPRPARKHGHAPRPGGSG